MTTHAVGATGTNLQAAVACSLTCTQSTAGKGHFRFLSYTLHSRHIRPASSGTRLLGIAGLLLYDPHSVYLSALLTVAGVVVCHGQHQAPTASRKSPAWRFTFPLHGTSAGTGMPVSAIDAAKVQVHCLVKQDVAGHRAATVTPVVWTTPSSCPAATPATTIKLVCARAEGSITLATLPAGKGSWRVHVNDATSRLWHFDAKKDLEFVQVHAGGRAVTRTAPLDVPAACVQSAQAAWDAALKFVQEELDSAERRVSTPPPIPTSSNVALGDTGGR